MYSIIIVNYKAKQLVLDCLNSIPEKFRKQHDCIVVDNASDDNLETNLRNCFPEVRFFQMGYNSGFARANNKGIKASKGSSVLLLNSDTLDINNSVERCFERFETDSEAIACGVQLLNIDGSPQISGSYFIRGGLNFLMSVPYLGAVIRQLGFLLKVKVTSVKNTNDTIEVDWINGAFLMFKKAAIQNTGLMDEDFFLYSEETEWCSRLGRQAKLKIYGDLNIYHLEGGSSSGAFKSKTRGYQSFTDKKGFQILISHLLRMRKQYGVFWLLFHYFFFLSGVPIYWLAALVSFRQQVWRACWGYSKNIFKCIGYLFKMIRNKPYFYKAL